MMEYQLQKVKDLSIKKGKHGIFRIVFGRTGILLLCLLLQLLLLFAGLHFLAQYVYVFFGGYLVVGLVMLVIIMNREDNPVFQLAWAGIVLLFPVFGGFLYLYVQLQPGARVLSGRVRETDEATAGCLKQDRRTMEALMQMDPGTAQLAQYIRTVNGFPVYRNTEVQYFRSGEEKFEELKKQLLGAEKFIFLEYFIIAEGYMWDSVFEILKAKVQEGVEVRVIYDGMNDLYNLPAGFAAYLKAAGIQCRVFSKVYPVISTHYNNRDHRKIVVIDGHTAFTGGINLADEYINRKERFGHWKDAAVMLRGEAVRSFTVMFLRMWDVAGAPEHRTIEPYLCTAQTEAVSVRQEGVPVTEKGASVRQESVPVTAKAISASGFVLPYAEKPFGERMAERIYIDILNRATRYVHIMTPYLIPGYEMTQALIYAAGRGVDVKIILPHVPDKKYAFALAHSYYKKLIQAGIHLYEYTPGFIHSKVFVSDDIRAVVGAINLDYRSLYLNFECAAFLYGAAEIVEIEADFRTTLPKCQLVTMFDVRHDKWLRKLTGRCLRLVAPLM